MILSLGFILQVDYWSNFQNNAISKNIQSQCTIILLVNPGQKINMLSKVCAFTKITFLGQLADFNLIIFIYLSTVSYEKTNIVKQFLEGRRSCLSYLHDCMAILVRYIKAFPNTIKNLDVCLLSQIYLFHHLKYKLQTMSKMTADKVTRHYN